LFATFIQCKGSDAEGRTAALLLGEPGMILRRAVRIDAERAQKIENAFAREVATAPDRYKDQLPAAGSEAAILWAIDDLQRGAPSYGRMSKPLADIVRRQIAQLHAMLTALGAVESVFFRGVGPGGWDIYGAKFARGLAEFRVRLAPDGNIDGSIPPLCLATPATWRPRCRSSAGVHGTRAKPRPLSIIANRPEVNVRIVSVPMTDRDPVEPGAEIARHLGCQVACEGFEIGHFGGILRRDDEAEMMPVVQAAPRERHGVGAILSGAEHVGLLTAAGDAVTLQVGERRRTQGAPPMLARLGTRVNGLEG
jgi:hypothetical protein